MARQQSFLGTVRKQIHSVYTILQLLVFDNCNSINGWQFVLTLLQLSNVSLSKHDCFLLSCGDDCPSQPLYCTYIQLLGNNVYYDVNNPKHEPYFGTPRHIFGNKYVAGFESRLVLLSKTLYHTCFICGQRCKWWSRRPKLTSSVISHVKPIIYIFYILHIANNQDMC